ncbi:MAG: hypothetical protein GY874_12245, partial [Desulfobacteraceae bacterium]|nr:hypothetical protein [Desulfobacteraceae bacterium]
CTDQNTSVDITLTGLDDDGDTLTFSYEDPSNGVLTGTAPDLVYTPNSEYSGGDSFTFTVSDGQADSEAATISITVAGDTLDNNAPVASGRYHKSFKDTPASIIIIGSDADGDTLSYSYEDPLHGTLSGTAPKLTYTPKSGYTGSDSFTFTVSDGKATSNTATITIGVSAPTVELDGNITKSFTGHLPGGFANAGERGQLPHYLARLKKNGVKKVPIRTYFASCDEDTETPRMFVSVTLKDERSTADPELPTVGSIFEVIYDPDTGGLVRTGNEVVLDPFYESHGITASSDCSRVAVLVHTYEEPFTETEPYTKDLVEARKEAAGASEGFSWMDQPNNIDYYIDDEDLGADQVMESDETYMYHGEMWLLEWNNQKLTEEPDKYVIHKAVGGNPLAPATLIYAEDDNTYGASFTASVFGKGGSRHKSGALVVINRDIWTIDDPYDSRGRGWYWNCGQGHVLHMRAFYNPYSEEYGCLCTNDAPHKWYTKMMNAGSIVIKRGYYTQMYYGRPIHLVSASNKVITNGGGHITVPLGEDRLLTLITGHDVPPAWKLNQYIAELEIGMNPNFDYGSVDNFCYIRSDDQEGGCYTSFAVTSNKDPYYLPDPTASSLTTSQLTKIGILETNGDGNRDPSPGIDYYHNINWIASDPDCQLGDPQLVDLQNGRYLLGWAKFLCISDDLSASAMRLNGTTELLIPKAYYLMEIDEEGNALTDPIELTDTGWGGLDSIISFGEGRAAWAYIPNPVLNESGEYTWPRQRQWELMIYESPLDD